jgi:hypothetical protein
MKLKEVAEVFAFVTFDAGSLETPDVFDDCIGCVN